MTTTIHPPRSPWRSPRERRRTNDPGSSPSAERGPTGPARRAGGGNDVILWMEALRRLDDRGGAYCHWKSNDHLAAALSADTDLDILVDPAGIDDVYAIFAELACRRARRA